MNLIRVAAASVNQTPMDWDGNRDNILEAIGKARSDGASILCLPELCISGYGCEDMFLAPAVHETSLSVLSEIAGHTKRMVVSVGLPIHLNRGTFNAACLMVDGLIVGFVAKQHLAGDGVHYEPRWFKPWPAKTTDFIEIEGERYPIGDLMFDIGGIRVGFEICEDAWVAERPGVALARKGVDIILNPSASHFAFGKFGIRKRFVQEGGRAFGAGYVYSNLLGNESGRIIFDGGPLIAEGGQLIAVGRRFSFRQVQVTSAVVDIDRIRMNKSEVASYRPEVGMRGKEVVKAAFEIPRAVPAPVQTDVEGWENSARLDDEEFTRAVGLGLFDYMRKAKSSGFVVSLSGGADSAAVTTLVHCMARLASSELGEASVRERLNLTEPSSNSLTGDLVHCVYQSTANSSRKTLNAARSVAEGLGAQFQSIDVDSIVSSYVTLGEEMIGRKLDWDTDDIALQNIQARARGPSVWLLANLTNRILLSTSNRSEAAVGYATMDGDTCGGLSPIAGIDKAFLLNWLKWMETEGPVGIGRIASLREVNQLEPTAELRPQEDAQTDEEDLMPYDILDAIEELAIRDKKFPLECYQFLKARFVEYSDSQLREWIVRFFKLWSQNQWKRERYAPSFHLDDKNLDPKTWCRFPILSGGYARELWMLEKQ